ncbi:MAG: hypothetical protein P1U67_01270, partial [Alcanivoracaceae bacterium]|nr:hypothetical protein [Alcanivoracaceae bacterium]
TNTNKNPNRTPCGSLPASDSAISRTQPTQMKPTISLKSQKTKFQCPNKNSKKYFNASTKLHAGSI